MSVDRKLPEYDTSWSYSQRAN